MRWPHSGMAGIPTLRRVIPCMGIVVSLAGCGVIEDLATPQACPAALLEGTLERDDTAGLVVRQLEVDVAYPVVWPDGWSTSDTGGMLLLIDDSGLVVGREGDHFSAGGGFSPGPDEVFQPCGGIEITPAGG